MKNKFNRFLFLLVLSCLFISSCGAKKIKFTDKQKVFSIILPAYWKDKYNVNDASENTIIFTNRANESNGFPGILFIIEKVNKEDWKTIKSELEKIGTLGKNDFILGEKGEDVYVLTIPKDVVYDENDEEAKKEYLKMASDIDGIIKSFKLIK